MGDFNFPDINWSSLTGHSRTSTLFCDFMFDNNLTQHVDCPTHTRGNILDLVLTANDELVDNLVVFNPNHSIRSDHLMISFKLLFQPPSSLSQRRLYGTESLFIYDFPKADMEGICSYLENSDFRHCFVSCDVDFVWSSLKLAIQQAMDLCIPKVRLRSYQFPKWFTPEIRHLVKCIPTLRRKCKLRPTAHNLNKLSNSERLLETMICSAKSSYESNLITDFASTNKNKIFKHISSITGHNSIPASVHSSWIY